MAWWGPFSCDQLPPFLSVTNGQNCRRSGPMSRIPNAFGSLYQCTDPGRETDRFHAEKPEFDRFRNQLNDRLLRVLPCMLDEGPGVRKRHECQEIYVDHWASKATATRDPSRLSRQRSIRSHRRRQEHTLHDQLVADDYAMGVHFSSQRVVTVRRYLQDLAERGIFVPADSRISPACLAGNSRLQ